MKQHNVGWRCCAVIALGVLFGCETVVVPPEQKNDVRQGDPAEPFFGRTPDVTMYSLESCARQLIADMRKDADFQSSYETKKKAKKNVRPTVIVGDIKNNVPGNHIQDRLDIVRNMVISTELSGLFTKLPQDAERPADYHVTGTFNDVPESDGRHNFQLYLRIKDVKSDVKIWEGFKNHVKIN